MSVRNFPEAEAYLAKGRNKNDRPLGANRRLVRLSDDDIAVRYYSTYIVTYHRDGTTTIYLGGYNTVTTRKWINYYSPARVYTNKGQPAIYHSTDSRTPTKIQKCRKCHGTGKDSYTCHPGRWYKSKNDYSRAECAHGHIDTHTVEYTCYGCKGIGKRDYGSKPIPTPISLYAAIKIDSTGKVIDGVESVATLYYTEPTKSKPKLKLPDGMTVTLSLDRAVPTLKRVVACPVCKDLRPWQHSSRFGVICENQPLADIIVRLNDNHKWTREQIADWLETLDLDIRFNPNTPSTIDENHVLA